MRLLIADDHPLFRLALVQALRDLFASCCVVPQRHVHQTADGMTSLIMPAWCPEVRTL